MIFFQLQKIASDAFGECVRIGTKIFTSFQVLKWKLYKVSKIEKIAFKKSRFVIFSSLKLPIFHFSCFLKTHHFKLGIFRCVRFWNKTIKRVILYIKYLKCFRVFREVCIEKSTYWNKLRRQHDIFCFFGSSSESMI